MINLKLILKFYDPFIGAITTTSRDVIVGQLWLFKKII